MVDRGSSQKSRKSTITLDSDIWLDYALNDSLLVLIYIIINVILTCFHKLVNEYPHNAVGFRRGRQQDEEVREHALRALATLESVLDPVLAPSLKTYFAHG